MQRGRGRGQETGLSAINAPADIDAGTSDRTVLGFRLPQTLSRRAIGIIAALAIELLLLLLLLTISISSNPRQSERGAVTAFDVREQADPQAEPEAEPETETQAAPQPAEATETPQPAPVLRPSALPRPLPEARVVPVPPAPPAPPDPEPEPEQRSEPRIRAVIRQGSEMGPPDTGRPGPPNTPVVGTAPDGSPLYPARWYREPYDSEISGYLSTARGPGWGMIVCRTVPDWKVEDCEIIGESPRGSGIARSTLAASWQFLVRPPWIDGEYKVGSWVRIRMTYGTGRPPGQ